MKKTKFDSDIGIIFEKCLQKKLFVIIWKLRNFKAGNYEMLIIVCLCSFSEFIPAVFSTGFPKEDLLKRIKNIKNVSSVFLWFWYTSKNCYLHNKKIVTAFILNEILNTTQVVLSLQ